LVIFQVCIAVVTVFDVCALNPRQKLALLRQGINTIPKLQLLGAKQDDHFVETADIATIEPQWL
jgi:hypothetical protein